MFEITLQETWDLFGINLSEIARIPFHAQSLFAWNATDRTATAAAMHSLRFFKSNVAQKSCIIDVTWGM